MDRFFHNNKEYSSFEELKFNLNGKIKEKVKFSLNKKDLKTGSYWYYYDNKVTFSWRQLIITGLRSGIMFYRDTQFDIEHYAPIESYFVSKLEPQVFYTNLNSEYYEVVFSSGYTKVWYLSEEEYKDYLDKKSKEDTFKIRTFTGEEVDVFDPDPDTINIKDIAHSLSFKCRFGGHSKIFYSVGQHSIECYKKAKALFPKNYVLQMAALMHDSTEAYLPDMLTPIKRNMQEFKDLENRLEAVIFRKFGISMSEETKKIVKSLDLNEFDFEWQDLMMKNNLNDIITQERYFLNIEVEFIEIFNELKLKLNYV